MAMIGRLSIWTLFSILFLKHDRAQGSPYRLTTAAAFVSSRSSYREEQRGCGRSVLPRTATTTMIRAGTKDDNFRDQDIVAFREEQKRSALVEALMGAPSATLTTSSTSSLLSTEVVGRTTLPLGDNNTSVSCVLLAPLSTTFNTHADSSSTPCLLVPLSSGSPGAMKLLSFAFKKRPVSKSVLITSLNPLLVNRDNGLFDNLPWSTWTVDPAKRNRDAANNLIMPKFHMGKRDAYQRFLGKDWPGRSLAIGNLALRLQYSLEADTSEQVPDDEYDERENELNDESSFSAESMTALAQRILELQLRDLNMELAEWDYQLALARANSEFSSLREVEELERQRQATFDQLQQGQEKLQQLVRGTKRIRSSSSSSTLDEITSQRQLESPSSSSASTVLGKILEEVALWTTKYGQNAAPYRGAMGYAPLLDTRRQVDASYLPTYTSPYDVMKDIIGDQLNADCIGVVLENTSFFQLTLGGAIILQRKTATQTKTILGEKVSVRDEEEDFGNPGVGGGETVLVECHADEAIGMALAYELPIRVSNDIWEQAKLLARPSDAPTNSSNVFDAIQLWEPLDTNITFLKEGQARNTTKATASPLRIPKTTSSLWDSLWENGNSRPSEGLFPTDNPIQSLSEYDELSNQGKARVLLSLSNFQGRLPRPRVVRQAEESASTSKRQGGGGSPLDKLLLPLIDESVRRQYLIRDAERRGDRDMLQQLLETKSMRQVAKERAEMAQSEEDAEYWKTEADFYASLRADVTQDEGSYNRYLDRDEWYERNRQAQAKRVNKKLFGTLLDGIE